MVGVHAVFVQHVDFVLHAFDALTLLLAAQLFADRPALSFVVPGGEHRRAADREGAFAEEIAAHRGAELGRFPAEAVHAFVHREMGPLHPQAAEALIALVAAAQRLAFGDRGLQVVAPLVHDAVPETMQALPALQRALAEPVAEGERLLRREALLGRSHHRGFHHAVPASLDARRAAGAEGGAQVARLSPGRVADGVRHDMAIVHHAAFHQPDCGFHGRPGALARDDVFQPGRKAIGARDPDGMLRRALLHVGVIRLGLR